MHWYDWHTITERLQGRAYALTRGRPYKVILDPNTPTGSCNFTNKKILINPNLFSDIFQNKGLSGHSLEKANFLVSRAVTGHESLHVLYSDPEVVVEATKESAILKTVLNLLEDARIEKIGSELSHVSKTLFGFVNGIAITQLQELADTSLQDPASIIHLLLRWRLGADIPKLEQSALNLWRQVEALANASMIASDCEQVLAMARDIVRIAGLDVEAPDDFSADPLMEKMQSEMTGERDSRPMPNPVSSADNTDPGDPEDDPQEDNCDGDTATEEQPGQETDSRESRESEVTGEDNPVPEETENDNAGKDTEDSLHSVNSDSGEDLEKLVEETARQVSEDLDSLVPPDSEGNLIIARSTPYRGRIYTDVIASPYSHYLPAAVPIAAELTRELRSECPRGSSGPSESPGKFRTRYYVRDFARPFSAQKFQGISIPRMTLSLVLDRSGSMENVVHELRTMAMAITMACDNLQIPLSIWALEGQVHIKRFDESGPQVLAKIAGMPADTLTRVMPTISDATAELKARPEKLKQMVLIHDGMPSDRQDFIEWREQARDIGIFCLFIMREEDYHNYQQNPQQLREHMDDLVGPRNYAIAPVTGIAKHWCSYIRNIRNRYTT